MSPPQGRPLRNQPQTVWPPQEALNHAATALLQKRMVGGSRGAHRSQISSSTTIPALQQWIFFILSVIGADCLIAYMDTIVLHLRTIVSRTKHNSLEQMRIGQRYMNLGDEFTCRVWWTTHLLSSQTYFVWVGGHRTPCGMSLLEGECYLGVPLQWVDDYR